MASPTTWSGWVARFQEPCADREELVRRATEQYGLWIFLLRTHLPNRRRDEAVPNEDIRHALKLAAGAGNSDAFSVLQSGFLDLPLLIEPRFDGKHWIVDET